MEKQLIRFSLDFQQNLQAQVNDEDSEKSECIHIDTFTRYMLGLLSDFVPLHEPEVVSFKSRGIQVNGYSIDDEGRVLDLYVSHFTQAYPPVHVRAAEIDNLINRVLNFYKRSASGDDQLFKEIVEVMQLSKEIAKRKFERVNLILLTDGVIKENHWDKELSNDEVEFEVHLWDLGRLYRSIASGQSREDVDVDFLKLGKAVPCLPMENKNAIYSTYLAMIPAEYLVAIYEEVGSRLLEKNVRSFLQIRGNVNKGIRNTIKHEPHMFLAYNNGLSVVAKSANVSQESNGGFSIKSISDFQVVNGGQTISTLFHVYKREKINLKGVSVQAKITIVNDSDQMDQLVPKISEYANSQNKIQAADFSVNHPYHRSIEELSRRVWTPISKESKVQTKWFYERARGQYLVDRNKEFTISFKRKFDAEYPQKQKFDKTDLAKYINVWNQRPYMAARGSQKNFADFMQWIDQEDKKEVSVETYTEIIALAIFYKETERLIRKNKISAYPANVTNYSIALFSYKTKKNMDFKNIWEMQSVDTEILMQILELAPLINAHINETSGNVNEYCKKERCWEDLLKKELDVSFFSNS